MKRLYVSSSGIRSIGYNSGSMTLEVKFQSGDIYQYQGVPRSKYNALMVAGSKGAFFNANIRDRYPTVRLEFSTEGQSGRRTVRSIRKRIVAARPRSGGARQ